MSTDYEEILYPVDGIERDYLLYLSRASDKSGTYLGAFAVEMNTNGASMEDGYRFAGRVLDGLEREGLVEQSSAPVVEPFLYPRWLITDKGRAVAEMSK
jgi:hypothetical protein